MHQEVKSMLSLIYRKKEVTSPNNDNLVLKDFICEVEMIDSVTIALSLLDDETGENKTEYIELNEDIKSLDGLKEYLLKLNCFYENKLC